MAGIATFTKEGRTRVAYTREEVVKLRFDGWTPVVARSAADTPPPKAGRGSGRDAWATYASQHGVEVTDEMNRDDIIAATDTAGVPTA